MTGKLSSFSGFLLLFLCTAMVAYEYDYFSIDDYSGLTEEGDIKPEIKEKIAEYQTSDNESMQQESSAFVLHEMGDHKNMPENFDALIEQIMKNCPRNIGKEVKNIIRRLASNACPNYIKPKKLLMTGPSGVGKTTLAKGIAILSGRPYILIRAPQLLTKFQFSGAEGITQVIKAVLALDKAYVIIVDEINALTDRFDREQQADKESATALWLTIDECAKRDDILFIGTTNDGKKIPPQLKTRFKNHILEIPLPDASGRKNIMNYYLKEVNNRISPTILNRLAIKAHGLSGRELEDMMTKAIQYAFDRNPNNFKVTYRDMERALNNIRPYGPLLTTLVDAWDNRKEIANELGPYMPVTSFVLNVVQTTLNEKNAWNQNRSQEKSYKLQQESFAHQKHAHEQSHALACKSFRHQQRAHRESHALAQRSYRLQRHERDNRVYWMMAQTGFSLLGTWFGGLSGAIIGALGAISKINQKD